MAEVRERAGSVVVHLVRATLRAFTTDRRMGLLQTVGAALLVVSEAVGALVLVDRFGSIGGWTASEVLLLLGLGFSGPAPGFGGYQPPRVPF